MIGTVGLGKVIYLMRSLMKNAKLAITSGLCVCVHVRAYVCVYVRTDTEYFLNNRIEYIIVYTYSFNIPKIIHPMHIKCTLNVYYNKMRTNQKRKSLLRYVENSLKI